MTGDEKLGPAALIPRFASAGLRCERSGSSPNDQSQTIRIEVRTPRDIFPEDIATDLGRSPHVLAVWNGK